MTAEGKHRDFLGLRPKGLDRWFADEFFRNR